MYINCLNFLVNFRSRIYSISMATLKKNPILIFILLFLLVSIPLWIFPINFFPGEIILENGLQQITLERNLSLSYFIGMGMNEGDLDGVHSFYLKPTGYILAFIVTVGIPALVALRFYGKK